MEKIGRLRRKTISSLTGKESVTVGHQLLELFKSLKKQLTLPSQTGEKFLSIQKILKVLFLKLGQTQLFKTTFYLRGYVVKEEVLREISTVDTTTIFLRMVKSYQDVLTFIRPLCT